MQKVINISSGGQMDSPSATLFSAETEKGTAVWQYTLKKTISTERYILINLLFKIVQGILVPHAAYMR